MMKSILFSIKAVIGKRLVESFYKKMGKNLKTIVNSYNGSINIEWAYIGNHKKSLILFLHGFSDRKENFYFASKKLCRDYDVMIPDLPGFGKSTSDKNLKYSLDNYEQWISEFIENADVKDFHLVGSSLGGAICAKLAVKYPERIKSLSLVAPAFFYIPEEKSVYDEALKGINLFQVETPEDYEAFRGRIFYKKPELPNFVKEYMIDNAIKNQAWYGKIFNEFGDIDAIKNKEKTLEEWSLNSICPQIKVPIKIFWGKQDTLFPYLTADFLKQKINGATTCIFENIGHCPHLENPKTFSQELMDFIGGVEKEL